MLLRRLGITAVVTALLTPALITVAAPTALADEVVAIVDAAEASPDGTVPIIVQLDTPAAPEGELSSRAVDRQRDRIDDVAGDALNDVEGDVEGVEVFETIPYISMSADAATIEDLAQSDSVLSVVLDEQLHTTLDSSVPVVQGNVTAALGYDGIGYNVAVVDTGVDLQHEFLAGKINANQACFARGSDGALNGAGGNCPNGQESQTGAGAGAACTFNTAAASGSCRHGTHVAGIAAGLRAGTNPAHGVADGAGIVPVQVFSSNGNLTSAGAWFSDVLLGLQWLDTNKASLALAAVNMSLGDDSEFASVCDGVDTTATAVKLVVDSLRASGIATVVSAGNDDNDNGLSFPACISTVVSVGSVNDVDAVSVFSNQASYLSLLAPGESVTSSVPDRDSNNDGVFADYAPLNGTSMAAPHVAGAWAVMRERRTATGFAPDVTAELAAMRASGFSVGGFPRLALYQALLPAAPTNTAVVLGVNDATVSWTAPTWTGGGVITSYVVKSWPTLDSTSVTSTPVAAGITSLLVSGLPTPSDYSFSVQAFNGISAVDAGLPSDAPLAPTSVGATAGDGVATLTWTSPASDGGAPITDYRITAWPSSGATAVTQSVGSATPSLSFTGLTNAATYTFTVTAVKASRVSLASAPSNAVTPEAPPPRRRSGGGGGGGGSGTTTTTTRPRTTTTTTTPPAPEPDPDPVASPGASVGNGSVVTIREGEAVVIPRAAPFGVNVVGGAVTPSGDGAWSVSSTGQVFTSGDAAGLGDLTGKGLNAPIVGIAPTPSGDGYWLLGRDGGIFSFGDAAFFGSTGNKVLNQPVVGMASTASGDGYWLFAGDGGIFTFGDADFFGSTGALRLNAPITTMAPSPTGGGYWLLGADGGVFTFGDAAFHGSTGGRADVGAIEALVPTPTGGGYWLIGNDGRLHTFGDAA